uniref:Tf2-1-like SH3-like domain-containing protein n=1 Tax=Nicotiana tabacum TaxID=4097 RepID=A0A1S4CAT8_TOBAC|nr:PREDICTED: uncharacterized protein LOC107817002 [Nicotiana tabacum]
MTCSTSYKVPNAFRRSTCDPVIISYESGILISQKQHLGRAFLGHVITSDSIKFDGQNLEAVMTWPRPLNPTEVRSFLGLAGYYRRFVEGFSSISAPLTKLTHKRAKFQWTEACEKSFQELKKRLMTASVLTLPDGTEDAEGGHILVQNTAKSSFVTKVKERQHEDPELIKLRESIPQQRQPLFELTGDGVLRYQGRLCVPIVGELRAKILSEAHYFRYAVHPGATKMLTKFAHFMPVRTTYLTEDYAKLYIREIVRLHGGVMRFGKKGKLIPRYVGPDKIIRRIGRVAYELDLPSELGAVHPVFHVCMLRKCIGDPSRITPIEDIHIAKDLSYVEVPVAILDRQVRKLRTKEVASVKVLWRNNNIEEMTWEAEEEMRKKYPYLFTT